MQNTVVITGAGVSVESGIQPFRGKNGLWNENPTEMASNRYFRTNTGAFLQWYYHRFVSCKDALPNRAHEILAKQKIKVVTQNVDNLHVKAKHPKDYLNEIHGNINFKRKINAAYIEELELANWNQVYESNLQQDLFDLFKISKEGTISETQSYRPHILLFDEYYTELYQYDKALLGIIKYHISICDHESTKKYINIGISDGCNKIQCILLMALYYKYVELLFFCNNIVSTL
jgi:NAD-dependent deacetylase